MNLSQLYEAAWWDTIKRQSAQARSEPPPVETSPRTPRKRALKYNPPKDVSRTISHSAKPGAETSIPTQAEREKSKQPTPEEIVTAVLTYVKNHPEARRDILLVVQREYLKKKPNPGIKEAFNFIIEQEQGQQADSATIEKITRLVQYLTYEQLRQLLIAI